VIATGTTSLRALESIPLHGLNSDTRIFIKPGDKLTLVDGLITNFHLPNTSLFVLVSTLLGLEFAHTCYQEAIKKGYRFYSYGDAMLIL
jgi:S-adenosylmethionine:tRNA ribosyltransferase-isomerase